MYPVKAAAELSGLTPETLRAWERRHAAVVPHRDGKGRRLYDAVMVERLTRLHRLTDRGHPIRDLAALDDGRLDQLLDESRHAGYGDLEALPARMLDAIADYQVDVFDRDLSVAIATLPVSVLVARVVSPLLREVGVRWADGRLAIAQQAAVDTQPAPARAATADPVRHPARRHRHATRRRAGRARAAHRAGWRTGSSVAARAGAG